MNKQTKNDISTKTNDNKVSNNFSMMKLWISYTFLHFKRRFLYSPKPYKNHL